MPTSPPHKNFRAVLFDLDGTLIDHFQTLYHCYRHTLETLGVPSPSPEAVRRSVGGSMEVTMRKFVGEELVPEAARIWREKLSEIYLDDVSLMPGAKELVDKLHRRGLKLGVLTNKFGEHSRGLCQHLGIDHYFDLILGANDTPYRKPQPEFGAEALRRLGVAATETCLVGDSPYDIDAARNSGLPCYCVTTGTHDAYELRDAGADGVYHDLSALGRAVLGA